MKRSLKTAIQNQKKISLVPDKFSADDFLQKNQIFIADSEILQIQRLKIFQVVHRVSAEIL